MVEPRDAPTGRAICLDSVMIDFSLRVEELPARGGDSLSSDRLVCAGGGFNLLSAVRRQGVEALYAGQIGHGRFADIARGFLESEGVTVAITPRGGDLGVCVVLVDATGERTFITSPGAELTVTSDDLDQVRPRGTDVIYVSGYNVVYPEIAEVVTRWLEGLEGPLVAFDPGPRGADIDPALLARVLARTDWLLCNAAEARHLSGRDDLLEGARELHERGCARVVVRDGARGCVAVDDTGAWHAPGFTTRVLDTNGAGDVHNGVVVASMLRGLSPREATRRANAAAAIAIASFGPATCPGPEEIDALIARQGGDVGDVGAAS